MSASSGTRKTIFQLQVQGDQQVVQKFKQVAQSMQQIQPASQKAAQSAKQVDTALKGTGTAATQSSTGLKSYGGALTSLGSANNQAKTSTDAFTGTLGNFNKTNTAAVGGLNQTNTVTKGLVPTMGGLDTQVNKTGKSVGGLTNFFRGNRGLIFSVTMLSSGISEAISMFQGYQDASEKLAAAKEKVADLEERGLQNTKDYGEAVKDASDAQRGFNFIQRFTIQSFADLAPMSLMLTSSLLDMTSKAGGLAAAKTKLAGIIPKVTSGIHAMGAAMRAFTLSHPLLLLLTALVAVGLAIITNFMGVRDALNQVGVALGNTLTPLKGVLEYFGLHANAAADTANSYLQFGQTAVAATSDVEKQVLKTGDATKLSYDEQIALMAKLGDEAKTVAFSLGAHLKMQQQDQEAHKTKYTQFVEAMQSGNEDIMQSLQLTGEEYKEFSEQFQEETEALDEKWGTAVESILENWSKVNEGFGSSVDSTVGEIIKLEDKIAELTAESFELDSKKELKKNREEIAKNQQKIDDLRGTIGSSLGESGALFEIFGDSVQQQLGEKITPAMEEAGRDFITLGEQAKQGLDSIQLGILSQDFQGAINGLATAIDGVPEKYQGNFSEIDAIIGNSALTHRQKVAQIVSEFGSLEAAFKPLINGAYELTRADAELAAGLDEVAVAARSNMTSMDQAEGAWNKFLAALSPAQRNLPIIQDLIARISAEEITFAEALQEAESAGIAWSKTMGQDVVQSIKDVEKSFIDMGDGTSAMVANVNGSMVNLGRVSNTELGNLSNDLGGVQGSMADTGKSAKQDIANEATAAVGVFGKDGKFHFGTVVKTAQGTIDVFKALDIYADKYVAKGAATKVGELGTTMTKTAKTTGDEAGKMETEFEQFKTNAVKWIGEVQTALDGLWKSAQKRLKGTNFQNLLPSIPEAGAESGGGQIPVMGGTKVDYDITPAIAKLDQLKAYVTLTTSQISASFVTMETSIKGTFLRIGTLFTTTFTTLPPAAMMATSQTSAAFITMLSSITGTITQLKAQITTLQTTISLLSTSVATYAGSMTTTIAAWITASTTAIGAFIPVITLLQNTFLTLSTSVAAYATSMTTTIAAFITATTTSFGAFINVIKLVQQTFSTLSTSVATYMKSMSTNTKTWQTTSTTAFNAITSGITKTQGTASKLSTSWSTYMKSMTSAVQKFSSAAVSGLNKVTSAANKATSALNKMAAAARKAASAASKVGGMEHGGSFIAMGQHGFSGIVNRPTTFKGVRMGEGFAPELVTVQPLTRGTGNHGGPTVSASSGGGAGNQPLTAVINVILDGRVIDRRIEKVALNNIGLQI